MTVHTCPYACSRCDITCPCTCSSVLLQELDLDGHPTYQREVCVYDLEVES